MPTTIYLVRHGQTEENAANILQGTLPGHLDKEGRAQAARLRDRLKDIPFSALYCSDLKRCQDTAAILNEPHGLTPECTPLLRERDWGPFTGMDILKARTMIDERAESIGSMIRRARTFLETVGGQHGDERVLVVSHGLFCRVMQAVCLGKTLREIPRMSNAEVRVIELSLPLPPFPDNEETGATAN